MKPIYQNIAASLELMLQGEDFEKLPTEAALCQRFGCSRQTVRAALKVLEQKGLVTRRQGSGTFPAKRPVPSRREIVMILPDRQEYTAPFLVRQAQRTAQEAGYTLLCRETRGDPKIEGEILRQLIQVPPAGVILQPITDVLGCMNLELLQSLRTSHVPLVYLYGRYDTLSPAVVAEDEAGGRMLAEYLAACGHRKIAAILKWDESRGIARYRGIVRGAQGKEIEFPPENCLWYSQSQWNRLLEGDNWLLRRFLEAYRGDCTAVVCFNDDLAFRLLRFLRQQKEELRLVSFDNSFLARDAAITSLGIAEYPAVTAILNQIEGKPTTPAPLPWKLTKRRSG